MEIIYCSKFWPIFWSGASAVTLGKRVFVRKDIIFKKPVFDSLIIHEEAHVKQQEKSLLIWWLFKYIVFPSFRKSQELEAYKVEFEYCRKLRKNGVYNFDLSPDSWAKRISGSTYFWMISYEEAFKFFSALRD